MAELQPIESRGHQVARLRSAGYILSLVMLIALFFGDVLFGGKTLSTSSLLPGATPAGPYGFSGHRPALPFSFDISGNAWVNEPNPYIIRQILDEGSLPAWNPREGLGIPFIANLNTEVFNPLKTFLNLFPGPFLQDIFFLLRLFVMGLFTYLFLTELKLSRASSFLGASSFMLSGYSIWWINLHPLSTVMYLPAVFYFYERWSEGKDLKSPFFMSLFLSFALAAGKIPDVIMGLFLLFLYAIWKGLMKDAFGGLLREGGKVIIGAMSGTFMASIVLVPFIELYSHSSPLARAIRTGAAGHTLPLITSVSVFQPLFLGWRNYFYGSWLKWTPDLILPHAGIVITVLSLYAALHMGILKKTFPYLLFSLFLFCTVYGILPSHVISGLPVLGSIEFLKYNAMFYFSLSVISAFAFDDLLSARGNKKKFNLSLAIVFLIVISYFFFLYPRSPHEIRGYMRIVLALSLLGIITLSLSSLFSKRRLVLGISVFMFFFLELFLYMPKDHPDRADPYKEPPYESVLSEKLPYRLTGDGSSIPPLVSNALGLYDIRAISLLLPNDYYIFSENLMGFSVPFTNNPNPLFSATSPFADLLGVKYILSQQKLERWNLEDEVRFHVASLRWIRFFDALVKHTIEGGVSYGFFDSAGEKRFCLFFPEKFKYQIKLRVTEPFFFIGLTMKGAPNGSVGTVTVTIDGKATELSITDGNWKDRWFDLSPFVGKVITVVIAGNGNTGGEVALGNFGLSPGYEKENALYKKLLELHNREIRFLEYKGVYEGIHIYVNTNVMDRAFILHRIKSSADLDSVIRELQEGVNFREIGLVTNVLPKTYNRIKDLLSEKADPVGKVKGDKVLIKKYGSGDIALEAESRGGLLVLSDLYYPGWKVKVNGRDEEIINVFGLLRGVMIGKGKSEVLFTYRPVDLYAGAAVSAATFIVWGVFLLVARRRRRILRDSRNRPRLEEAKGQNSAENPEES